MQRAAAFLVSFVANATLWGSGLGCGDGASGQDDDDGASDTSGSDPTSADTSADASDDPDSGTDSADTESSCSVTPPDAWAAPDWDANTTDALALRASLDTLVGTMRMAEQGEATVEDIAELQALFESGTPSLSSIASPGYAPIVEASFTEFVDLVAAGEQDLIDDAGQWAPGTAGGIFGSEFRGIHEGGLEIRQLVDKGLFSGGALYRQALLLTTGTIDEATIDSIAALWGANSALDPAGELTDAANYSFEMGYHAEIADALLAAKAYAGEPGCEAERDEAIRIVFRRWELAMFARFVFYANVTAAAFELGTMDDDFAGGLHELGEGLGLVLGFHRLEHPDAGPLAGAGRVSTDAQLDAIAASLGVDIAALGMSTTGQFVADYLGFVDAVAAAEDVVTETFALESADLGAFREPTPG